MSREEITIGISPTCHGFDEEAVGTRVMEPAQFLCALAEAIVATNDTDGFSERGTAFIPLDDALKTVSAGVGKRSENPDDYVCREHRGRVSAYLKREFAAPAISLSVVVYTKEAYLSDPDVKADAAELKRASEANAQYYIVAILASATKEAPVTPYRFCHNVAGGNIEYWDKDRNELVDLAKASLKFDSKWAVVAD